MKPRQRIKLIFWDSCIFFAWIKDEPWPEDIKKGIEQTLEQAYSNQLVIVTSSITLAEVIQSQLTAEQKERYAKIFQHPNLQLHDIDRRIAGKAGVIREAYDTRVYNDKGEQLSGSFMSLGDSLQLATALHLGVREFHTLDGSGKKKRLSLLALNGNVAGAALAIVKPYYVAPPSHFTGPLPGTTGGSQAMLFESLGGITEGQPQTSSADTASGSTDVPSLPAPNSAVAKPEATKETNAEPSNTQSPAIAAPPEVRGSDHGHPKDKAGAEAASQAEGQGGSEGEAPKPEGPKLGTEP